MLPFVHLYKRNWTTDFLLCVKKKYICVWRKMLQCYGINEKRKNQDCQVFLMYIIFWRSSRVFGTTKRRAAYNVCSHTDLPVSSLIITITKWNERTGMDQWYEGIQCIFFIYIFSTLWDESTRINQVSKLCSAHSKITP